MSLDGRLFDNLGDAAAIHNQDILLFSNSLPTDATPTDLTQLGLDKVKSISYPVTTFSVKRF